MAKKLTSKKARKILHDKSVHGNPLTEKQRKFFGAIAGGAEPYKAQIGTMLTALPSNMMDRLSDALAFPQRAITKLFTGEYQTPSEAMKIQNPVGAAATDILLDPVNLLGAGLAGKAAKASTKTGILSNAYKLNPWAFKPNPEAYYRGVGKQGMEDILQSGIIRSKKQHAYPEPYFSKGMVGDRYAQGYFAELINEPMKGVGGFPKGSLIQTPVNQVSVSNPNLKLYQKDWLKGYKEVKPLKKKEEGGWLDKYEQGGMVLKQKTKDNYGVKPNVNDDKATYPDGFVGWEYDITGRNYSPAWGGQFAMGGSLPGATGMMYARTINPAPSNGPYAKKTKASAQNGMEMKYYQEGLDFKPKTISQDGSRTPMYVSNLKDPALIRYNDSLALYNNYIKTKASFDKALVDLDNNPKKIGVTKVSARPISNPYQLPDEASTIFMTNTHPKETAPQYDTRIEGNKVKRIQTGNVTFPAFDIMHSTLISPVNILEYNPDYDHYVQNPNYTGDVEEVRKATSGDFYWMKNPKEKAEMLKKWPYLLKHSKRNIGQSLFEYVKPVQPVVYKPDFSYQLPQPKQPTTPKLFEYNPDTPTKFSFTIPTGKYNEQKTMYFPTKSALKAFAEGIRGATYQEGDNWASATGNYQDGGNVDPMGYWNPENWGKPVTIPSNEITMEGVYEPLIGISDTGDVQYMEPGEDYQFDGEYVTEYPVAQKGIQLASMIDRPAAPSPKSNAPVAKRTNIPTEADSARLYNAQVALNKFYDNEVKAGRLKKKSSTNLEGLDEFISFTIDNLREENLNFYRDEIKTRNLAGKGLYDDIYKEMFGLSPEQVKSLEYKGLGQTKSGSEYQEYYRDLITPLQNLAAPLALVDKRIAPQRDVSYEPIDGAKFSKYPGGSVTVFDYDPLAIKPYSMRTEKEKIEWEKKYGKSKVKPKPTPKPTPKPKPVAPKPALEPEKLEELPVATLKPGKKPKPVLTDYFQGQSVFAPTPYGGGAAFVGYKTPQGDTVFVKPEDYERMGVPKYGREFIESKKKQRNGGVNNADAQPIEKLDQLLNFTNYNKPTKGGWLDKYQ